MAINITENGAKAPTIEEQLKDTLHRAQEDRDRRTAERNAHLAESIGARRAANGIGAIRAGDVAYRPDGRPVVGKAPYVSGTLLGAHPATIIGDDVVAIPAPPCTASTVHERLASLHDALLDQMVGIAAISDRLAGPSPLTPYTTALENPAQHMFAGYVRTLDEIRRVVDTIAEYRHRIQQALD